MEFWTHVRACQASNYLAFGAQSAAQWLIPIMTTVRSIASIHAKSNEFFDTLSSRMAAFRSSVLVRNFG